MTLIRCCGYRATDEDGVVTIGSDLMPTYWISLIVVVPYQWIKRQQVKQIASEDSPDGPPSDGTSA